MPTVSSPQLPNGICNVKMWWLPASPQFLEMERYAEAFVDNGYEDFETVKQMGRPDLETVGVADYHMDYMLTAVAVLQQKVPIELKSKYLAVVIFPPQNHLCHLQLSRSGHNVHIFQLSPPWTVILFLSSNSSLSHCLLTTKFSLQPCLFPQVL